MASKQIEFDAVVNAAQINRLLTDLRSEAQGAAKAINDALGGTVTKKIVFEEVLSDRGTKQLVAVEKERLSVADQLINRQKTLNKTQEGSKTSLQQQLNNLKQQRDGVVRYQQAVDGVAGSIRKQNPQWTELNAQVSRVQRELAIAGASTFWEQIKVATRTQGLINFGNGLVGITQQLQAASIIIGQFLGAINQVVDASSQLQSFALSFDAIGLGAAGANTALRESQAIALGLGVNLNTVQEGFKQLSPVVLNSGGTIQDVSNIVKSLSSRFAAFGISGDRARRVTNGVIQAFAKGKLQAEELTQQISEADPAFKTDLAKALKISVVELEKWVKQGKVTPEVLIDAIPLLSKASLLFGKLGDSATSAAAALARGNVTIEQVKNSIATINQLSLRNLATSFNPVINSFFELQAIFADFFNRISRISALESIGKILGNVGSAGNRLLQILLGLAEAVLRVVAAIAPLIERLTAIPGVIEVIGLLLAGRLLAPLGKAVAAFNNTASAAKGLATNIVSSLKTATQPVDKFIAATKEAQKVVQQSIKSGLGAAATAAPTAPLGLDKQINKTLSRIQVLKAELSTLGGRSLTDQEIKKQRVLQTQLTASRTRLQALYEKQQVFNNALTSSRRQQLGFDPAQLRAGIFNIEENTRALQRNEVASRVASSSKIQGYNNEIKSLRTILTSYRNVEKVLGGTTPQAAVRVDDIRARIREVERLRNIETAVIKERVASQFSLNAAQANAARDTSNLVQQNKLLNLQKQIAYQAQLKINSGIAQEKQELSRLAAQRQAIIAKQAASPFLGPAGAGRNAEALRENQRLTALAQARLDGYTEAAKLNIRAVGGLNQTIAANNAAVGSLANRYPILAAAQRTVNVATSGLSRGFTAAGSVITATVGGLRAATRALLSALGPLGILLITVGALQSAYANANEKAAEATRRNAQEAVAYEKILNKINGAGKPPELGPIQKAWELFSIEFADTVDRITERVNEVFSKLLGEGETRQAANPLDFIVKGYINTIKGLGDLNKRAGLNFTPLAIFASLADGASDADIEVRKSARGINKSLEGIERSAQKVTEIIQKLRNAPTTTTGTGQIAPTEESIENYRQLRSAVDETSKTVAEAEAAISAYKKKAGDLKTPEAREDLKKLNDNLAEAKARWNQATSELNKYGKEFGALRDIVAKQNALGINAINESIKASKDRLELQVPNTVEFEAAAADLAAFELELEKLQDQAKDPVQISAGIDQALTRQARELFKFSAEREDLIGKGSFDAAELQKVDEAILKIRNNIRLLEQLRVEVNADSINNAKKAVEELEKKIVRVDIDSPELPKLVNGLLEAQENADRLDGRRILTTVVIREQRIQEGTSTVSVNTISQQAQDLEKATKQLDFRAPEFKPTITALIAARQRSEDIEKVFQRLTRTPYQIDVEAKALDAELTKSLANLSFTGLQQAPLRESVSLIVESNKSIRDAQAEYAEAVRRAEQARKLGVEGEKVAASILIDAGKQLEASTNNARANLISAAQNYKRQLSDAQTNLSNLVLEKPQFFTTEQVQREKDRINKEFEELVLSLGVKVTLTGTPDEILKQKQDFIDTRKRATDLQSSIDSLTQAIQLLNQAIASGQKAEGLISSDQANNFANSLATGALALDASAKYSENVALNLIDAASSAQSIADSIKSLQDLRIKVSVSGVQGYWTGGPTTAGQLLRINELGQEGFVTASGQMKPINKPRNALWRAPSTGYVIPAHIWSEINAPSGVVSARQPAASVSSGGSVQRIASMIRSAVATNNNTGIKEGLDRLANVQASQAIQLGKLSHAVGKLNEKDWNVKVSVTPKDTNGYIGMINRGI